MQRSIGTRYERRSHGKGYRTVRVRLGERSGVTGSVRQQVYDGDTINVHGDGNFGVRFLGVDAPEISFTLPGGRRFIGLADPRWQALWPIHSRPPCPTFIRPL